MFLRWSKRDAQAEPELAGDAPSQARLSQLRSQLEQVRRQGLRSLSDAELREFPALYRYSATRLARERTRGDDLRATEAWADATRRAHQVLYEGRAGAGRGGWLDLPRRFFRLWFDECPRAIRAEWRILLASLVTFHGLAALAFFLVSRDLDLAPTLLQPAVVADEIEQLRATAEGEPFRGNFTFGWSQSAATAGMLIAHNVTVATLIFGAALLPPLYVLLIGLNALMVGTYLGVASHWGQSANIASILMCHGTLELHALTLAGGAGWVMARGLLRPGPWTRAHALQIEGERAARIFAGVPLMLVAAGWIEAYVSPHAPETVRLAFAVGSGLLLVAWVALGGRGRSAAH